MANPQCGKGVKQEHTHRTDDRDRTQGWTWSLTRLAGYTLQVTKAQHNTGEKETETRTRIGHTSC